MLTACHADDTVAYVCIRCVSLALGVEIKDSIVFSVFYTSKIKNLQRFVNWKKMSVFSEGLFPFVVRSCHDT